VARRGAAVTEIQKFALYPPYECGEYSARRRERTSRGVLFRGLISYGSSANISDIISEVEVAYKFAHSHRRRPKRREAP